MVNSRTPTMNSRMKPADSAGSISGTRTRRCVASQRAPEVGGSLLELPVDLQEAGARQPRGGGEAVGIGDDQNPDRAVETDRQRQIEQHHAEAGDHGGDADRKQRHEIERMPNLQPRARDDPAEQGADRSHDQRRDQRHQQRVAQSQPERPIGEQRPVGLQAEIGGGRRDRQRVAEQARPQQHRGGKHGRERDIDGDAGERRNAPGAERQSPLPIAASGHRDETVGAPDQPVVDEEQQHSERHERQRQGRGAAVIGQARQRVELEIDAVAEHVDPGRQADDQRQLELLGSDERDQDQRRQQARQQHRQRDPAERGQRRGAGAAARLFQRRIHSPQGGGEQQEYVGRRGQRLTQDQPAHAEDIDRPRRPRCRAPRG